MKFPFLVALALFFSTGCSYAKSTDVTLDNGQIHVEIDTAGGLRLTSLRSGGDGDELLAEAAVPLYQVLLAGKGGQQTISSRQASNVRLLEGTGTRAKIASQHVEQQLQIECNIELDGDTVLFGMDVRRRDTAVKVGLIRYPGYGLPIDSDSSRLLLPVADGTIVRHPVTQFENGEERGWDYPGLASVQMMAGWNDNGGVVTWTEDARGFYKRVSVRRAENSIIPIFEHITLQEQANFFSLPYRVRVTPFQGDWRDAADLYRKWAEKQPWCSVPLSERTLPESISKPTFFLGINAREVTADGSPVNKLGDIPSLAASWGSNLSMPVTVIVLGWEKYGAWITPDYFPPFGGEEAYRTMLQALHPTHQAMAYLSGLRITLEKSARPASDPYTMTSAMAKQFEPMAIVGRDGNVMKYGTPDEAQGIHYWLCPAVDASWNHLEDASTRLAKFGIDIIQIDQMPGGGCPACFSTSHNHPIAGGTTTYDSVSQHLRDLKSRIRQENPRAAISLECPGELYIPDVDIFHTREYMHGFWPREQAGEEAVPLFSYLYHDYAMGYGGDSAPWTTTNEYLDLAIFAQALNLNAGRYPGSAVWMKSIEFPKILAIQAKFMKAAADLYASPAGEYLQSGRMRKIDLGSNQIATLNLKVLGKSLAVETPKVLSSAYQLPDGSFGVLAINIQSENSSDISLHLPSEVTADQVTIQWPKQEPLVQLAVGSNYTLPSRSILFYTSGGEE